MVLVKTSFKHLFQGIFNSLYTIVVVIYMHVELFFLPNILFPANICDFKQMHFMRNDEIYVYLFNEPKAPLKLGLELVLYHYLKVQISVE